MSSASSGGGPEPSGQIGASPAGRAAARRIVIAGATGFVGKALAERWPVGGGTPLRLLIHRTRPDWIDRLAVDVAEVDLQDTTSLAQRLEGADAVINLLRPDGSDWHQAATSALVEAALAAGAGRYVHISSIDVYGSSPARVLSEDSPIEPRSAYERGHAAAERVALGAANRLDVGIVRLGAVFGDGGRNVVAFANEMRRAPTLVLAARRMLFGARRMHLVSVEAVADALHFLSTVEHPLNGRVFLVVDDDQPENNFAWLQDVLAEAFGRSRIDMLPSLPPSLMQAVLRLRRRSNSDPMRRFVSRRLAALGFRPKVAFPERVRAYAAALTRAVSD